MCQTQVENSTWYICGLVDADQFDQAKKGIAPSKIQIKIVSSSFGMDKDICRRFYGRGIPVFHRRNTSSL